MSYSERPERSNTYERMKGTLHLTMGVFYLMAGTLVLYIKYFGAMELSAGVAYTLGTMMIVYGAFRVWRGFVAMKQKRNSRNGQ